MEIKNSTETMNNQTTTTTVVETVDTNIGEELVIDAPILILFAEYLGFVSPLIEWAEKWCTDANFPSWKKKFVEIDACFIYRKMLKEFSKSELKIEYNTFYEIAIKSWVEKLNSNK